MKYSAIAVFAALALSSAPALAHRHDHHRNARFVNSDMRTADHALELRDDTLKRRSLTKRLGPIERQEIAEQRQEIRELRERLADGHLIDRYTLYRALGGSSHPIYFDSDLS